MEQKKRHNPPIKDEEPAVQAFDRNNDALPADSLEGKVKTSSVKIEKTEDAIKKEISKKFCDLVNEVFGSKNYSFNAAINIPAEFDYVGSILYTGQGERPVTINEHDLDLSKSIRLSAFEKPRWYQLTKSTILHVQVEVDLPDKTKETETGPLTVKSTFLEDNKYAPIKVYVRDTESLPKAKLFAQKYQELTGQKARVIQDCPDEETKTLEEQVEKPNFKIEGIKRVGRKIGSGSSSFAVGVKNICEGFTLGFFALPSMIRTTNNNASLGLKENKECDFGQGFGAFSTVLGMGAFYFIDCGRYLLPHSESVIFEQGHWMIPVVHLGSNLLSGGYEWWKHETKKAEEEYQKKQNEQKTN